MRFLRLLPPLVVEVECLQAGANCTCMAGGCPVCTVMGRGAAGLQGAGKDAEEGPFAHGWDRVLQWLFSG